MRTTLTLDEDVARTLKAGVRHGKVSFKEAVNRALRAGLGLASPAKSRAAFVVKPHSGGFKPGIDPHKLNKLAADLEDESIMAPGRSR